MSFRKELLDQFGNVHSLVAKSGEALAGIMTQKQRAGWREVPPATDPAAPVNPSSPLTHRP